MKHAYQKIIESVIRKCLQSEGWKFFFDAARREFHVEIYLDGNIRSIHCIIQIFTTFFIVYARFPMYVDTKNREIMTEMSEFIHRANYGLMNGNFEFDFRDGEIRYKYYVDCRDIDISNEMVFNAVSCSISMCMRYGKGVLQILFNGMTGAEANILCEREFSQMLTDLSGQDREENVESRRTGAFHFLDSLLEEGDPEEAIQ